LTVTPASDLRRGPERTQDRRHGEEFFIDDPYSGEIVAEAL